MGSNCLGQENIHKSAQFQSMKLAIWQQNKNTDIFEYNFCYYLQQSTMWIQWCGLNFNSVEIDINLLLILYFFIYIIYT